MLQLSLDQLDKSVWRYLIVMKRIILCRILQLKDAHNYLIDSYKLQSYFCNCHFQCQLLRRCLHRQQCKHLEVGSGRCRLLTIPTHVVTRWGLCVCLSIRWLHVWVNHAKMAEPIENSRCNTVWGRQTLVYVGPYVKWCTNGRQLASITE